MITGGSAGIGRAAALAFARIGAAVVIIGRTPSRIEDTVRALQEEATGPSPMGLALDVCREGDMGEMVSQTMARHGRIDVLVVSGGILRASGTGLQTLWQMSYAEWQQVLDVNLTGTFLSNRAVLPVMAKQRTGQIINISSTSGRKGLAYDSAYCASKFGVIGMSQSLAEEARRSGIRVQVLLPGAIETTMWDQNGPIPKPGDVVSADHVADVIVRMALLPLDSVWEETVIEPFRVHDRPAWFRNAGASVMA